MKKVLFLLLMCMPIMVCAQDDVEMMTPTYVKADVMAKAQGSTK